MGKTRCGWGELRGIILFLLVMAAVAAAQDKTAPPSAPEPQQTASEPGNSQPAQSSTPEKKESSNPAAQAAVATRKVGVAALNKARDWETGWFAGVYVEKGRTIVPMTAAQRRSIYFEQTLGTPGAYMKRMFAAGIDQARGSPPQWQGGWGGYGERLASREGQFISANSLAALGNAALRYEPRYDQCQCSGLWPRTRHAIVRNFVTYDSSEKHRRPQWALFGGAFGGGMISTAWKPEPRNAFAEGGRAMLGQAGWGALLNFFIEFAGDINHKIGAKNRNTQKY